MSMTLLTSKRTSRPKTTKHNSPEPLPTPNKKWFWAFLLIVFAIGIVMVEGYRPDDPFIIQKPDGSHDLADWRKEKLDDDIRRIRRKPRRPRAEQYALVVAVTGWFPCYSCVDTNFIYLNKGEIYKYGKTINGQKGRYGAELKDERLLYQTQFVGTEVECLVEERRKIYYYALLPENIRRSTPLMRPPGNKRDY